jgi:fatty acid/phospholipid biosynthesis enzyme
MKIGFDIMGGDHAPANEIEGAILASAALPPSVKIILIGDADKAKAYLKSKNLDENIFSRLCIQPK